MANVPTSRSFTPIDSGGYDIDGSYYPLATAAVFDSSYFGQGEDVFVLYDTSQIKSYMNSLYNPTITISFHLSNGYYLSSTDIGLYTLAFTDPDNQSVVVSNKTNPAETFGTSDGSPYSYVTNLGDLEDASSDGTIGPVSLTGSTNVTYNLPNSLFTDPGALDRGILLSGGNYTLTRVSNVTLTVSGFQQTNLPVLEGIFPNATTLDSTTLAPFSQVTATNPGNPSGLFDDIVIYIEDAAGNPTDALGTLSLPAVSNATLLAGETGDSTPNNSPGSYTLFANGPAALQAALQSLVFTPTSVSSAPQRVNFELKYNSDDGSLGTTTALESVIVSHDQGLDSRTTTVSSTDLTPLAPFANVYANLPQDDRLVYATATVLDPEVGTISGPGVVALGNGVYQLDQSAPVSFTTLSTQLQALSFTPAAGQHLVGINYPDEIQLSVTDTTGATTKFADTTVVITATQPVTASLASNPTAATGDPVTSSDALTGTGDANALVIISNGSTVLGTTLAGSDGAWSYTPTLADGSYTLTVSQRTSAGPAGAVSVSFILDTTPPAVTATLASDTGISATDGITSNDTLSGTGEANALVTISNGSTALGTTTAGPDGTWSYTPALTDGSYTLTASETDSAGNTGSTSVSFTLDTKPPAVTATLASDTGVSSHDGITSNDTLSGTGDANALVTISNGSAVLGSTTAGADGTWSYTPALTDGSYTLTASETDSAGNTGSTSVSFTLDTKPPAVTATLASDTGVSTHDGITSKAALTGGGDPGALVTISNGSAVLGSTTAGADGTWSYTPALTDGSYTLTASETDSAGNTGSTSVSFTLDTAPPAVTATLASDTGVSTHDGITSKAALTGGGDPGALVTISNGSAALGTTTAGPDGTWSYTPALTDGSYTLTASETDSAGNTGTGSASVGFTLDDVPP